jgi:dCTP diphosphatase
MTELEDLQTAIVNFRDERNWKQFHNPKDLAISLVLEATEFMEHFQWKTEEEIKQHLSKHGEDVSDELIDTLYWILLIAHDLEIDIAQAFERKMSRNKTKYPIKKAKGNHAKYTELGGA